MTNVTPLPFWQMCCVASLQIAEAMNICVSFPFIVAMIEDFGCSGAELGYNTVTKNRVSNTLQRDK